MRILLFGRLRDLAGGGELTLPTSPPTLGELRQALALLNPALAAALADSSVRVAVDRRFVAEGAALEGAQEVAFMPPMSGG